MINKAINIDSKQRYESVSMMLVDLNLEDKSFKLKYYLINLPGFKTNSLIKKILALAGYILIFLVCMISEMTVDNKVLSGFDLWLNRILVFIVLMTIILFAGNYLEIWNRCFLAKSKSKLVRVIGIVVTATAWIFLEAFIVGCINSI